MNKIKNVLLWIFSVFMLLFGVVFMGNSVISAVFMFVAGIISNPLFLKKVHINRIINVIACIVLFFAAAILLPGSDTNKTLVTAQSTEETTKEKTIEKTTEKESTKSKKELEESSSIAASKRAVKESSVAASKAEESRKAAKEESRQISIAQSQAEAAQQASIAQSQAEAAQQASIAQSQAEAAQQISIAQSQAEAAQQASIAQSQAEAAQQASIAQSQQASIAQQIPVQNSRYACWVPNGKSYHFTKDCPTLRRSKTILEGTVQNALSAGKTDPCNICAGGR